MELGLMLISKKAIKLCQIAAYLDEVNIALDELEELKWKSNNEFYTNCRKDSWITS